MCVCFGICSIVYTSFMQKNKVENLISGSLFYENESYNEVQTLKKQPIDQKGVNTYMALHN